MDYLDKFQAAWAFLIWLIGATAFIWHKVYPMLRAKAELSKSSAMRNNSVQFLKWADQAVAFAEKQNLTNPQKKQVAVNFVTERLAANKMAKKFSLNQISAVVEMAVNGLDKANANNEITSTPTTHYDSVSDGILGLTTSESNSMNSELINGGK